LSESAPRRKLANLQIEGSPAMTDPVPSIREADATGEIAALYGDIRETLGVPVVNLIWRHLAVFPGGLGWAWESLKPLYASGAIAREAIALRGGLEIPVIPGLTAPALAALGLSNEDIARINMILSAYERSNAMNMIALGALLARLEGSDWRPETAVPKPADDEAVEGEMPPLLALDEMEPHVRALVEALNAVGGRTEILASMYRHLANWPPYLGAISALITPFASEGRLEPLILGVVAEGRRRAAALAGNLATPDVALETDVEDKMRATLGRFIDGPIGKMIAIVPLIKRAMPAR
jgi:hypothetical protein